MQEISKDIIRIPSDEPPVFIYPSNYELQYDGSKFYDVVTQNLYMFGIISHYEKKLIKKEELE